MTVHHLTSGEVVNLRTLREGMPANSTIALVKAADLEVIRMVIPKGKRIPEHSVPGKISVQCLEGITIFTVGLESHRLEENSWLFLNGAAPHSLEALEDSVLLVTILLTREQ